MRRYESFNPWEAKLQNVMDMYPPVGVKSFGMTKKLAKTRLFWENLCKNPQDPMDKLP